jgi:predicted TIM-barrel fold metal-dependent hydrolase
LIDLHTHLHPPRLFAAIRRWFAERSSWKLEHATEPAAVAQVLRAHGIRRFVFCSYAHRPSMARELNAWLVETARLLGGYGLALATVHPGDPDYVGDLELALAAGCVGLKLHEDVQRVRIDDDRLTPVYERLAERGFLLAHVGPIPWRVDASAPTRVERVLRRHPRLRLVVAHMGGGHFDAYFALMARHPNLYLDTTMAFASDSPMRLSIPRRLVQEHAERIVYGTDFPNIPYPYGEELRALQALSLGEPAMRAILHDNAARILQDVEGSGTPRRSAAF